MPKNLFITGHIRTGKSTLLKSMIDPIKTITGGFFVQRLFIQDETRAFRLVDVSKENYIPNRHVEDIADLKDLMAVNNKEKKLYYEVFKTVGVSALEHACKEKKLILMDELGRIETKVPEFMDAVFKALDSSIPVLGVIKKESNFFLDKVRVHSNITVIDMDEYGLERTKEEIFNFLSKCGF
jgi:nucleoside-triphosphatase